MNANDRTPRDLTTLARTALARGHRARAKFYAMAAVARLRRVAPSERGRHGSLNRQDADALTREASQLLSEQELEAAAAAERGGNHALAERLLAQAEEHAA